MHPSYKECLIIGTSGKFAGKEKRTVDKSAGGINPVPTE
jgi:hypothetical protein